MYILHWLFYILQLKKTIYKVQSFLVADDTYTSVATLNVFKPQNVKQPM